METFDIRKYTTAPLQLEASIHFKGKTPEEVFEILSNPKLIPQWFLLAKVVKKCSPTESGETAFNVEFTFFGDVFEEILEWNPPIRYVYLAKGEDFPIKDYVAWIEVQETNHQEGKIHWKIYFSKIAGYHFQKIIPVIFPPIIEESFRKLCPLIGGLKINVRNNIKTLITENKS